MNRSLLLLALLPALFAMACGEAETNGGGGGGSGALVELCDNGIDDDADGFVDCDDAGCGTDPACTGTGGSGGSGGTGGSGGQGGGDPELCANGLDDDGDGDSDCEDADCAASPSCVGVEDCANGLDDDRDGAVDCADTDCNGSGACSEECGNGLDDDSDGDTDCDDGDCAADPACQPTAEICDNGGDDDGDGAADCLDTDCGAFPACQPGVENCGNGRDDDGDGLADCDDLDCAAAVNCQPANENCVNGVDDDGDGAVDCADPDCDPAPICQPPAENCVNGVDDDGDGAVDCADPDCAPAPACRPGAEQCTGGADEDRDGLIDCDDPDCAANPACLPPESCGNGVDDDGDAAVDCADGDCAQAAECTFAPNALVITEIMFNPAIDDDGAEWVELHNPGASAIDLRGFSITDLDGPPSVFTGSVVIPAGGFAIVGQTASPSPNGPPGLAFDATYAAAVILTNGAGDQVQLADPGGRIVDTVDFASFGVAVFGAANGRSLSLDSSRASTGDNDLGAAWCASPNGAGDPSYTRVEGAATSTEYASPWALAVCPGPAELCSGGLDEDGDGLSDCADPDCAAFPACLPVELCDNAADDDGDTLADCADPDCAAFPACLPPVELCGNGADDDADGAIDCLDPDCTLDPACLAEGEICGNAVDDDGDSLVDCADPECYADPGCIRSGLVINEVDYDQVGGDTGEFIELYNGTGSSFDLTGLALVLVNGSTNAEYRRIDLSGSLPAGGYLVAATGTVIVEPAAQVIRFAAAADNVQNGAPDGIAIVDTVTSVVIDALSYEGSITAAAITGFPGPVSLVEGTATALADDNVTAGLCLIRSPNGLDTDDAATDWATSLTPTPGAANVP